MKYFNILVILILMISFSTVVYSDKSILGTYKQNDCIYLYQSCSNCSTVKFTFVVSPNNTIVATNINSSRDNSSFTSISCVNASQLGEYGVHGISDMTIGDPIFSYSYFVTPSGTEPSTSQGLMYSFMLVVLLILFGFSTVGAFIIDTGNKFTMGGDLLKINFNKYYAIGLFFLSYLFLIFITFTIWQISVNFLFLNVMANIFHFIFTILMYLLAPVFIAFVLVSLIKYIADAKIEDLASRGLKPYDGDK